MPILSMVTVRKVAAEASERSLKTTYAGTLYDGWACYYLMAMSGTAQNLALLHALGMEPATALLFQFEYGSVSKFHLAGGRTIVNYLNRI